MPCEKVTVAAMTDAVGPRRSIPADAAFSTWQAPDGWAHRRYDRAAANPRGRILVQGGRADIVEKYLETIDHLHGQDWSVTTFDWRGQGGSGRLAADAHVGHAQDFGVFVADLAAFWAEWRAESEGPAVLLAHSMGAHLALRALLDRVVDPQAVVLVAPMVQIRSPLGVALGMRLARLLSSRHPTRAAWKVRPDQRSAGHRQRLLTHDRGRFEDEAYWYGLKPELLLGPPSWSWVREALTSGIALEADRRIESLTVPILMLVANQDGLVDPRAALRVAARLPDVELISFGAESAHEILREDDAVRSRAYSAIDDFLDARVPRP